MTKTIELTLEKPCDLKPGHFNLLKVDGKTLTVEVSEDKPEARNKHKESKIFGLFAEDGEWLDEMVEMATKSREAANSKL
jgi:hypothetical protein